MDLLWPEAAEIAPSWNVAPTQNAPIVRDAEHDGRRGREMIWARWGLIPSWAKDDSIGTRLVNARAETAPDKPAFRSAMSRRRCIVPVSGFYEWQKSESGAKKPWYIYRADERIMLLAGLWESWTGGPDGPQQPPVETFTILTTSANSAVAPIHDRMPVVLEPEQAGKWLDRGAGPEDVRRLLAPAADGVLAMHRVGTGVNSPRRNDAHLLDRVVDGPSGGLFEAG